MAIHRHGFERERPIYRDRVEAGRYLAEALRPYHGPGTLILGIPRGGVPVAAQVAHELGSDLDVVVARKLSAPGNPELAIGAVTANGGRYLNEEIIRDLGVSQEYLDRVIAPEMAEAHRREVIFRAGRGPISCTGRIAIIVDDGLATGATMRAAVRSVRMRGPLRLIAAVPVGAAHTCMDLRTEVDDLVCLAELDDFWAVGYYYERFEPIEDQTVERILHEAHALTIMRETRLTAVDQ